MIKEDIPLYKLDLTGNSKYNLVLQESKSRTDVVNNQIFIPPKGPFYQKSFKMYDKAGKLLVENEDYEFYGLMAKLTQYTGKPVGLFVRILKDTIVDWKMDYQVVGNFNAITNEILNMLQSIYQDDRYVFWDNIDNKPLWFIPEIHRHDLAYDIFGFTDLVRELNRVATYVAATSSATDFMLESFQEHLEVYINGYKEVLTKILDRHINNKMDAHGVNKGSLGLGNVANVRVATLEETLDGTRDDLRVSVYNAAKAAEASSGRNDKLFPSGSLPILRYGSDTFIPPTIGGSFEGLGGTSRRSGAVVETDGTLLVMTHRNNGKFRGLYFTRCRNYLETTPNYDFTAYMYQHPTATAAGATLDTIINGSNQYVMVVGDSKKNMWWWCETHGTFNPDRHVLIRLSGEWISQDTAIPVEYADVYNLPSLAMVMADKNYQDHWAIVQPYRMEEFLNNRRPGMLPDYPAMGSEAWGSGLIINAGMSINVVSAKSGTIKRARINFNHPVFGNYNDFYFTPWFPKTSKVNGKIVINSYFATFDPPATTSVNFASPMAFWMNTGNFGEYGFRYTHNLTARDSSGVEISNQPNYRGIFNITQNGNNVEVKVTPASGMEKLWTIDLSNQRQGVKEFTDYINNVPLINRYYSMDQTGGTVINGGYLQISGGTANVAFPPVYRMDRASFLNSIENFLAPPKNMADSVALYSKRVVELNPVGMGSAFSVQRLISADFDDYTKAGYMVRQFGETKAEWFYRSAAYMNSNFDHVAPPLTSNFQGVNFAHYPFVPSGMKCSIGQQIYSGIQMPRAGVSNKDNQHKFLGASTDSTFDGSLPAKRKAPNTTAFGDNILPWTLNVKTVEGVINMNVLTAIDLNNYLTRVVIPAYVGAGFTEKDVRETWAVHMALTPSGGWDAIWIAFSPRQPAVTVGILVTTITPSGTPAAWNGISLYPDASGNAKGPLKTLYYSRQIATNETPHLDFGTSTSTQGFFCSVPYKGVVNGARDTSAYNVIISTQTRYVSFGGIMPAAVHVEISADGTTVNKIDHIFVQDWGYETNITCGPYYGPGWASTGANIFEGAAVGSRIFDQTNSIHDNITNNAFSATSEIGMSNILTPQYTVYFQAAKDVLIAGKMYDIPATYIDILNQDASPANKTYYVYLQYSGGQATYVISSDIKPESSSQALIAKVICGPTQIDRIEPYNRFTMDGAQISAKREGSAILASSGSLFDIGDTSTILLNTDFIS